MQSYDCKQVPVGMLQAEKIAEVVLFDVFRIWFPASLLKYSRTKIFRSSFSVFCTKEEKKKDKSSTFFGWGNL